MSDIDDVLECLKPLFEATEEALSEWQGTGNLQFPVLLGMLAVKLNWDDKQTRENDPLVRFYIRHHKDWYVTRGAHGGIMRASDKQKKEAAKAAKESVKKQLEDAIASGLAAAKPADSSANVIVNDDGETEESE